MSRAQKKLAHHPTRAALLATLATGVAFGAQAPAHAAFVPITGVTGVSAPASVEEPGSIAGGSSPSNPAPDDDGVFDTLTVGGGSVSASALVTGTTTFLASAVSEAENAFARTVVDDLDIFNGVSSGGGSVAIFGGSFDTIGFGGAALITANTDPAGVPDFFIIEAVFIGGAGPGNGNVDEVEVAAILADGSIGLAVAVPALGFGDGGDLGVNLAGENLSTSISTNTSAGVGEFDLGGFAFSFEDLLDADGNPLTPSTPIQGVRVFSAGLDLISVSANVVPEPGSVALLALGAACGLARRGRREA